VRVRTQTGATHRQASVGTISSTAFIPEDFEELTHILIAVDVSKEIQEKQAWGVITRRAVRGISVCDQRPNKGEVDQGGYHPGVAAPDSVIGKDLNELFFKVIVGKERQIRERPLKGERNF
jgi:hypothetical protein